MDPVEQDSDLFVDLESGNGTNLEKMAIDTSSPTAAGGCILFENGATLVGNISNVVNKEAVGENNVDLMDKSRKERRKTMSAKKPPRPPKALSLGAADQKLINEIAELAMIRRARIERMKAMKKAKVSKASASTGNILAMIFSIIFCLVIIFQGACHGRSSGVRFLGSPESAKTFNSRLILLHSEMNTSDRDAVDTRLAEQASRLHISNETSKSGL